MLLAHLILKLYVLLNESVNHFKPINLLLPYLYIKVLITTVQLVANNLLENAQAVASQL